MQLKLEQDWNELAGAHSKESPVNLVPRMRTLLEVALKDHYRTSGVEWPQDLASAISKFIEGNGLDRNLRFSLHEIRVKANQVLHEGFRPVAGPRSIQTELQAQKNKWCRRRDLNSHAREDTTP